MPPKKPKKKPVASPAPQQAPVVIRSPQERAVIQLQEFRQKEKGRDSSHREYTSFQQMWTELFLVKTEPVNEGEPKKVCDLNRAEWYDKSEAYWKDVKPTVDGMLGGLQELTNPDIKDSAEFLKLFISGKGGKQITLGSALDVGAGIGRITKQLLAKHFEAVDLLEMNQNFLDTAQKELGQLKQVRSYICASMQDHVFTVQYDVIWIQWVIIYLTDDDFVAFFEACRNALTPNGLIIVKDNFLRQGFNVDLDDRSITRSEDHLKLLFAASGLTILQQKLQSHFPPDLFPVKMYALSPTK